MRAARRLGLLLWSVLLASPTASLAEASAALDPAALAIVHKMAAQLRSLPALRVVAAVEYDALQRDGQTLEFGSTRELSVRRPDRLRAHARDRSGGERSLYYDGRQVTVLDPTQGVYATTEQTGDVDAVLRFAEEQLGIPVPLSELLRADLGERLGPNLFFAAVVGEETLDGVRCDHLALRNADRGIQLWVQQGETPLPRRIAITWEQAPGRPQFRARLTDWELSPKLPDALFAFTPPKGMERIPFFRPPAADAPTGGGR